MIADGAPEDRPKARRLNEACRPSDPEAAKAEQPPIAHPNQPKRAMPRGNGWDEAASQTVGRNLRGGLARRRTGTPPTSPERTSDGLDDLAEEVRRQAEDLWNKE